MSIELLCRKLVQALKEARAANYNEIDGTWQWGVDEMSEETVAAWMRDEKAIRSLIDEIENKLNKIDNVNERPS
jgi:hypothetical protein